MITKERYSPLHPCGEGVKEGMSANLFYADRKGSVLQNLG